MGMAEGAYKSSKQALAWFFEKSRDKWKMHCRGLRKKLHVMAVHVADATRARDGWRAKAEAAESRAVELEARATQWQAMYEVELKKTALRLTRAES